LNITDTNRRIAEQFNEAFNSGDLDVAEGEWVVVRCTYSGTHRGTSRFPVDGGMLVRVQPTGRTFEVQHIHMYRVLDGKIAEHFANRDDVGMMRQLGLLSPLSGQ
jgi:predicted ester cyclase